MIIAPDVQRALDDGSPVVALETAVVTHGMPRRSAPEAWPDDVAVDRDAPLNLELARAMERTVRGGGATPATVAVIDGVLHVGCPADGLESLAADANAAKASNATLATILAEGRSAGTTVSATLMACHRAGIHIFATGGIGGVHRGWTERPDISGDLTELSRARVAVISTGAKSILDGAATLEALETLGVSVVGFGTSHWPRFTTTPDPALTLPSRVESPDAVAALCRARWATLDQDGGILVANPLDPALTLDPVELEAITVAAESEATAAGHTGSARTPAVLDAIARLSHGRSLRANVALLLANAELAARIAVSRGE